MDLKDAVEMIKFAPDSKAGQQRWADLGCGSGIFTLALAELLPAGSIIIAVDKDKKALKNIPDKYSNVMIEKLNHDFLNFELTGIFNGIMMANSLHFVKDKLSFLKEIIINLNKPEYFLIVEYDTDISNPWVPYPLNFQALRILFESLGFKSVIKLNERPSIYRRANIYSALINRS